MIQDTLFSPTRFVNYCRKDMVEHWRTNLIRIVMLYGVMALLFVVRGYFEYRFAPSAIDPMVNISLKWGFNLMCIFGVLLASVTMDKLKTKTSRLSVFMSPVTPFENFFSRWLTYTIVYLVIFLIMYICADFTRVIICRLFFPDANITMASLKYLVSSEGPYQLFPMYRFLYIILVQYFLYQSFFVLGSTVWPRNSFIKTLTAGIGIYVSYLLVAVLTVYLIFGKTSIGLTHVADFSTVEGIKTVTIIIPICFTLINWVLAYYRFKETDLIN